MSMMSPSKAAGGVILAQTSITFAANEKIPAGTKYDLDLKWNPDATPQTTIIIPANETWELKDLYLSTTLPPGVLAAGFSASQVKIKKDADRIMDYSEVLAAVITTNPGRPNGLHANITYEGASQLSAEIQTTAEMSNGAQIATVLLTILIPYEKHA